MIFCTSKTCLIRQSCKINKEQRGTDEHSYADYSYLLKYTPKGVRCEYYSPKDYKAYSSTWTAE